MVRLWKEQLTERSAITMNRAQPKKPQKTRTEQMKFTSILNLITTYENSNALMLRTIAAVPQDGREGSTFAAKILLRFCG